MDEGRHRSLEGFLADEENDTYLARSKKMERRGSDKSEISVSAQSWGRECEP